MYEENHGFFASVATSRGDAFLVLVISASHKIFLLHLKIQTCVSGIFLLRDTKCANMYRY